MKTLFSIVAAVCLFIGPQALLLGALYRIQSWEMPQLGGMHLDLIVVGVLVTAGGAAALFARNIVGRATKEDRLELDDHRITKSPVEQLRNNDDDLYV